MQAEGSGSNLFSQSQLAALQQASVQQFLQPGGQGPRVNDRMYTFPLDAGNYSIPSTGNKNAYENLRVGHPVNRNITVGVLGNQGSYNYGTLLTDNEIAMPKAGGRMRFMAPKRYDAPMKYIRAPDIIAAVNAVNNTQIQSPFVVGNPVQIHYDEAESRAKNELKQARAIKRMAKAEDGLGVNATNWLENMKSHYPNAPGNLVQVANQMRNLTDFTGINTGDPGKDVLLSIRGGRFVIDDGRIVQTLPVFIKTIARIDKHMARVFNRFPLIRAIKALRSYNKSKNRLFKYVRAINKVGLDVALNTSGNEWATKSKSERAAINTIRQSHIFNKPFLTYKQAAWRAVIQTAAKGSSKFNTYVP